MFKNHPTFPDICGQILKSMRVYLSCVVLLGLLFSCGSGEEPNRMIVKGNVKGLKKGTLFLQNIPDTTLTTIDSLLVQGDGNFQFETSMESPEVFYLYLDKKDNNEFNDRITFFGEPGTINISTSWNTFETKAVIEGSETQKKLEEYQEIMNKFHGQSLDLMRASADPQIQNDSIALDSLQQLSDKVILRGYLYTLNFALNNSDSYVAPYLALSEVANANPIYLDSIYNALSPEVAASKYGKKLEKYLKELPRN